MIRHVDAPRCCHRRVCVCVYYRHCKLYIRTRDPHCKHRNYFLRVTYHFLSPYHSNHDCARLCHLGDTPLIEPHTMPIKGPFGFEIYEHDCDTLRSIGFPAGTKDANTYMDYARFIANSILTTAGDTAMYNFMLVAMARLKRGLDEVRAGAESGEAGDVLEWGIRAFRLFILHCFLMKAVPRALSRIWWARERQGCGRRTMAAACRLLADQATPEPSQSTPHRPSVLLHCALLRAEV